MIPRLLTLPILLLALAAGIVSARGITVVQQENVRYAYAQVLRVSPVYQTLTATRMEERCDQTPAPTDADSRISRVVGVVRGALAGEQEQISDPDGGNCRSVPVSREFHRPIAYDVDYHYQGAKYRSRLPDDPGNRLRIRIGVTPVVSGPRSR